METDRPNFGSLNMETKFTRLLQSGNEAGDCKWMNDMLKKNKSD